MLPFGGQGVPCGGLCWALGEAAAPCPGMLTARLMTYSDTVRGVTQRRVPSPCEQLCRLS